MVRDRRCRQEIQHPRDARNSKTLILVVPGGEQKGIMGHNLQKSGHQLPVQTTSVSTQILSIRAVRGNRARTQELPQGKVLTHDVPCQRHQTLISHAPRFAVLGTCTLEAALPGKLGGDADCGRRSMTYTASKPHYAGWLNPETGGRSLTAALPKHPLCVFAYSPTTSTNASAESIASTILTG